MKKCNYCKIQIEESFDFCPKCGKNLSSKKTNIAFLVLIPIVIFAFLIFRSIPEVDDERNIEYKKLDPQELHTDYINNEISAKDKYSGNYYYFSGSIYDITEFLNDKYLTIKYIYKNDKTKLIYLNAYFSDSEQLMELRKNDKITVYCKFKDRSIKNYLNTSTSYSFKDCKIK